MPTTGESRRRYRWGWRRWRWWGWSDWHRARRSSWCWWGSTSLERSVPLPRDPGWTIRGACQDPSSARWCAGWWLAIVVCNRNFLGRWSISLHGRVHRGIVTRLLQKHLSHRQSHLPHHLAVVLLRRYLCRGYVYWLLYMLKFSNYLLRWCNYLLCLQIHSVSLSHHFLP